MFAVDGKHGGGGFGGTASFGTAAWVMGAEVLFIGESSKFMGTNPIQPLEAYRLAGAFAGRQWKAEEGTFTAGLGAGLLKGIRRTDLERTVVECEGWSFFGCRAEDEVTVEYYGSRRFAAPALNPLVAAEARLGGIHAGVWVQAFINAEQGLGIIALVLRFGS